MEQDTHLKTVQSTINIKNNIINFKLNMGTLPATVEDIIFVISFTQAGFLNPKFYTQKFIKNTPKH